jgi:hypothetical protein
MRTLGTFTILLVATMLTIAQEPPKVDPRFGVEALLDPYPQRSPRETLESAIKLIERGKFDYLAAHVIEPDFVDERVAERAVRLEADVDAELRKLRIAQRNDPLAIPRSQRLPDNVAEFNAIVAAEARVRAFRQVAAAMQTTMAENPDHLKDLRRLLRSGTFVDAGQTANLSQASLPDRNVFFRKIGPRWFIENRQKAEAPAAPGM